MIFILKVVILLKEPPLFDSYLILLQTKGKVKQLKSSFNKIDVSEPFLSLVCLSSV